MWSRAGVTWADSKMGAGRALGGGGGWRDLEDLGLGTVGQGSKDPQRRVWLRPNED